MYVCIKNISWFTWTLEEHSILTLWECYIWTQFLFSLVMQTISYDHFEHIVTLLLLIKQFREHTNNIIRMLIAVWTFALSITHIKY